MSLWPPAPSCLDLWTRIHSIPLPLGGKFENQWFLCFLIEFSHFPMALYDEHLQGEEQLRTWPPPLSRIWGCPHSVNLDEKLCLTLNKKLKKSGKYLTCPHVKSGDTPKEQVMHRHQVRSEFLLPRPAAACSVCCQWPRCLDQLLCLCPSCPAPLLPGLSLLSGLSFSNNSLAPFQYSSLPELLQVFSAGYNQESSPWKTGAICKSIIL